MPTYEYICDSGHPFTEVRSIHEEQQQTTCPTEGCGAPLKRVYGDTAAIFRGAGYYSNDSKYHLLKKGQQVDY